jgi:membrane protease YdiL (CAAX protease family)
VSITSFIRRRSAPVFLAAAIAAGWVVTVAVAQLRISSALLPVVAVPVSSLPAVLALVMLRLVGSRAERAALRRRLTHVSVDPTWYVAALIVLPAIHLAGVGLASRGAGSVPFHPGAVAFLPLFLVTSLGEEIGWRGYALPKLQERYGLLVAALLVGLAWSAFHWPAFAANPDAPWAYVLVSTALFTALGVVLAFGFDVTGQSLPIVVIAHAAFNTVSVGVMPLAETGVPLLAFTVTAVVAWLVAGGLVAASFRDGRLARSA